MTKLRMSKIVLGGQAIRVEREHFIDESKSNVNRLHKTIELIVMYKF